MTNTYNQKQINGNIRKGEKVSTSLNQYKNKEYNQKDEA